MKTSNFHAPFLKELVVIAAITICFIVSSRFFAYSLYSSAQKNTEYTSQEIQLQTKHPD